MGELNLWQPDLAVLRLAQDPLLLVVLQELELDPPISPSDVEDEVKIKRGGAFVDVKYVQYSYVHF